MPGFALFDTAWGSCGIAWTDDGVSDVQLPDDAARIRAKLAGRYGPAAESEPPEQIRVVIAAVVELFAGDPDQTEHHPPPAALDDAVLDPAGVPAFNQRVYAITRAIPAGSTLSYGEVAARIGTPGAARAVGRALGENPYPILVPCHRVLAADGSMHGFSGPGGIATKRRMLQLEGAVPPPEPTLF